MVVAPGLLLNQKYLLGEPLGEGGFGIVLRARDITIPRDVAIKVMREQARGFVPDAQALARFHREAQVAANLNHPGITVVYDVGRDGRDFYIVMELLTGNDLQTTLRETYGGLPVGQVVEYMTEAAEALAYAHGSGVIHRDLKPANMFVVMDPVLGTARIKICDFGLARLANATGTLTGKGTTFGTPEYMSPEQFETAAVNARADLYSLGCVMYALLTGAPPFRVDVGREDRWDGLRERHRDAAPKPPQGKEPIPRQLSDLVLRLLAKEPDDRPQSALAVAAELRKMGARGPGREDRERPPTWAAGVRAPIACSSLSREHREIIVAAGASSLVFRTYWPDASWSGWSRMKLPPGPLSAIAAGSCGNHQKLAAASGGNVYHRWQDERGDWSNWHGMEPLGTAVVDLSLCPVNTGRWEVFALDATGMIHRRSWRASRGGGSRAGGWGHWHDMPSPGGKRVTAITADSRYTEPVKGDAISWDTVRRGLFSIVDGSVWRAWWRRDQDGRHRWLDWKPLRGLPVKAIDIAAMSLYATFDLLVLGDDGQVWHRRYSAGSDSWGKWRPMPGPEGQRITAIALGSYDEYQKLVALSEGGHVYHSWSTMLNDWSPWRDLQSARVAQIG